MGFGDSFLAKFPVSALSLPTWARQPTQENLPGDNMELEHILRKTDKGRVEVQTRAYQVGPRERSVLIMVDGKTPARLLLTKLAFMKKADAILDELRVGGFIDVCGTEAGGEFGTRAPRFTPLTEEMRARRQFARHFILEAFGPSGDYMALRLEGCQSREALLPLLEECREYIEVGAGSRKAQQFWNELGQLAIAQTAARRMPLAA
jgi:hypothetical protein